MKRFCLLSLILLVGLCATGCTKQVEIIAHRGASHLAPENTMASVMLGWEKGADVEVDIYLTKDNRIVVIHDGTTKRTGDKELKVIEATSHQLRTIDVGTFKSVQYAGERIPFLDEVIVTIPRGRKMYIEIKSDKKILPHLEKVIDDSGKRAQVVIIAFDFDTIVAAKKQMPDIGAYWLKGTKKDKETGEFIYHDVGLVDKARNNGLDGLDLHYGGVTVELVEAAKAAGQKFYVWTIDDINAARRMIDMGVTGITTNRPGWMKEQLKTVSGD